jgi:hypothetical protein
MDTPDLFAFVAASAAPQASHSSPPPGPSPCPPVVELIASIDSAPPQQFHGRQAWALNELVQAGERGCTPITTPGPRWSDYVFKLRRDRVTIETIDEPHGGSFSGRHAKYILRSRVVVRAIRRSSGRGTSR